MRGFIDEAECNLLSPAVEAVARWIGQENISIVDPYSHVMKRKPTVALRKKIIKVSSYTRGRVTELWWSHRI